MARDGGQRGKNRMVVHEEQGRAIETRRRKIGQPGGKLNRQFAIGREQSRAAGSNIGGKTVSRDGHNGLQVKVEQSATDLCPWCW